MTYLTDERLKSFLDTNQLHREQMSLAILSLDERFSNLVPRHPRGGPDGGRDIEAMYEGKGLAYCAVGFVNQAVDSNEKKKEIKTKFKEDLANACNPVPKPNVFIFLTNINLTVTEKSDLIKLAKDKGFSHSEIFDRERLRVSLDSASGFAARFQYLGISLSEAEQRSFFAKWGDGIQSLISDNFINVTTHLSRIHFFQEAEAPLNHLSVMLLLDEPCTGDKLGHMRAFSSLWLKEFRHDVSSLLFGAVDDAFDMPESSRRPYSIRHFQWLMNTKEAANLKYIESEGSLEVANEDRDKYREPRSLSDMGNSIVRDITLEYRADSVVRSSPWLKLGDLSEAMMLLMLSKKLAERVKSIHVHGNGYVLFSIEKPYFRIDATPFIPGIPVDFNEHNLADEWVCLRPTSNALFRLNFSDVTPSRLGEPDRVSKKYIEKYTEEMRNQVEQYMAAIARSKAPPQLASNKIDNSRKLKASTKPIQTRRGKRIKKDNT